MPKSLPFVILIAPLFAVQTIAQITTLEVSENQGALIAQLGIVRMVTTYSSTSSIRTPAPRMQETYFDSLGRITRIKHDLCDACGTVYEYDSLTGLVSYTRETSLYDVTENFKEYDAQGRRSAIETCNPKEPSCVIYWYEYDTLQTARVYKTERTTRLRYDKTNRTRLKHTWETKRALIQELLFNPQGQLEETRFYEKEQYDHSLFYEYDQQARWVRTWSVYNGIKKLYAEIEYNEKGQITLTKTAHVRGSPSALEFELYSQTYEYDDNGLLLRSEIGTNTWEYSYFTE